MRKPAPTKICEFCHKSYAKGPTVGVEQFRKRKYCSWTCCFAATRKPLEAVFERAVLNPLTECLEFTGCLNNQGYGQINRQGKGILAHRAAYEAKHGPIPKGKIVLHRCDNPACINIDHLTLGTMKDNSQDMSRKGRAGRGGAKLTERQIVEIYFSKERNYILAKRYAISPATITGIKKHRRGVDRAVELLNKLTGSDVLEQEAA